METVGAFTFTVFFLFSLLHHHLRCRQYCELLFRSHLTGTEETFFFLVKHLICVSLFPSCTQQLVLSVATFVSIIASFLSCSLSASCSSWVRRDMLMWALWMPPTSLSASTPVCSRQNNMPYLSKKNCVVQYALLQLRQSGDPSQLKKYKKERYQKIYLYINTYWYRCVHIYIFISRSPLQLMIPCHEVHLANFFFSFSSGEFQKEGISEKCVGRWGVRAPDPPEQQIHLMVYSWTIFLSHFSTIVIT